MLHRRSLDKSSENDASLETLKDAAASARKGTTSPMIHKQPPLVIEEDELKTEVKEYTQLRKQAPSQPAAAERS